MRNRTPSNPRVKRPLSVSFIDPALFVKKTKTMGNGVFTSEDLPARTLIEVSPVWLLNPVEFERIQLTSIGNNLFQWGDQRKKNFITALALGFVSVYNHSKQPNCYYEQCERTKRMFITTNRPIKAGEQLTVSYGVDPWFEYSDDF